MNCYSIDCGTPKRYCVVCKFKYLALNTLRRILTPKRYDKQTALFIWESPPPRATNMSRS